MGDDGDEVDACWYRWRVERESGTGDGGDGCGVLAVGHMAVELVEWWMVSRQQQGALVCVLVWFSTR